VISPGRFSALEENAKVKKIKLEIEDPIVEIDLKSLNRKGGGQFMHRKVKSKQNSKKKRNNRKSAKKKSIRDVKNVKN